MLRRYFWLFALLYAKPLLACSQEPVCVQMQELGQELKLVASNHSTAPVTVRVDAVLSGLKASPGLPAVMELGPKQQKTLQTLTIIAPWKLHYWSRWSRGSVSARQDQDARYRLPWQTGRYKVLQSWGGMFSHDEPFSFYAVDFAMPEGTVVTAARAGRVVAMKMDSTKGCAFARCAGDANYLVLEHSDKTLGEYFHLQPGSALVRIGQWAEVGTPLAHSGNTGFSTEPHLHFVVKTAGEDGRPHSLPFVFATDEGNISGLSTGQGYSPGP